MHCLLCYTAAQHLSAHHARERTGNSFMLRMHGLKKGRGRERERGQCWRCKESKEKNRKRGLEKKNGGAEQAASIGKLYN